MNIEQRPRRLRASAWVRDLIHEVEVRQESLIQPYFLADRVEDREPIAGFSGVFRWSVESLSRQIEKDLDCNQRHFLLFGKTELKDETGSAAHQDNGIVSEALKALRARFGKSLVLFTDVCLCPYTTHGHCGVLTNDTVDNDASLEPLAEMAVAHAAAGADFVAPSDMMDGRVGRIRKRLDQGGFSDVGILAYTAKFASSYYGPFREALGSAPQGTDRATYQMDFRNSSEALRELRLDTDEGADMVMVKPALAYLDIIAAFRQKSELPVVAYSVSAEYEMVKMLAKSGLADERKLAVENLTAIRRAGAQAIITYHASEAASLRWFR